MAWLGYQFNEDYMEKEHPLVKSKSCGFGFERLRRDILSL